MRFNSRQNTPCLPNFNFSANEYWEKRFSQSYRLANWHCIPYKKIIEIFRFCLNQKQNGRTPIHQVLTSDPTRRKMAPVWQIFILQQIKIERNGFHSLADRQICISYHMIVEIKFCSQAHRKFSPKDTIFIVLWRRILDTAYALRLIAEILWPSFQKKFVFRYGLQFRMVILAHKKFDVLRMVEPLFCCNTDHGHFLCLKMR